MPQALKDFDSYGDIKMMRNILFSLIFFGTLLYASTYFTGLLLVYFVEGSKKLASINTLPPFERLGEFVSRAIVYWKFWLHSREKLGFTGKNMLGVKLITLTSCIYLPLSLLLFLMRDKVKKIAAPFGATESLHGDAHWATPAEIKKAGLFNKRGMLMGEYKPGNYFTAKDYQHVLLFAPTGSGKGVGFVIPNLLFWDESVFVHDIKLENYLLTSGWRSRHMKQKVFAWVPAAVDGKSHCYNPLDWVSKNPGQMVDDVQKIGNILIEKQEFWENEARSLVTGVVILSIADPNRPQTFGEIVRILRDRDTAYLLAQSMDTMGGKMHPVGYMNLSAFLQKADKERSGCVSTANSRLDLWANPIVDKITSRSDFDIQTFKKVLSTVYVGLTPDNIQRLRPLMSMFYQQASTFLSRKMPEKNEPYGVMFLMDEFPTLGKMEQFLSGIAYFRGYHVKLFLIVQDTQQLKGAYEDSGMNSFLSNSTYRITFAANNVETSKLISELIGNKTVASESFNKPKFFDLNPASRSLHLSKTQRALLLPQEVLTLDRDLQIILIEASSPIMCKKIKYYADPYFKKRLVKEIPLPVQPIDGATASDAANEAPDESPKIRLLEGHPDENPPPKPKQPEEEAASA